jgi:hypothetical protein
MTGGAQFHEPSKVEDLPIMNPCLGDSKKATDFEFAYCSSFSKGNNVIIHPQG